MPSIIGTPKITSSSFFSSAYNSYADNLGMLIYDGKKIEALREAKRWKQSELAKRAGLSQPSVWALEHEVTKMPKFETLQRVADALGVPVKAILRTKVTGKEVAQLHENMQATFESLTDANKVALLAAAQALLDSQGKK